MQKMIAKMKLEKKKAQEAFFKYSDNGRIGMEVPPTYIDLQDGPSVDIKLKPTKIPKKSKKIYKDIFIRKLGHFNHLYSIEDTVYIVSILKDRDIFQWIDNNIEKIKRRVNEL